MKKWLTRIPVICSLLVLSDAWGKDYSTEIREVRSGIRNEAKASWWGFQEKDSTRALQAAIDSGAKKVIVDYTGKEWLTAPLKLRSNMELILEDNVVVRALPGAYKSVHDCMLNLIKLNNVIIRGGKNSVLRMNKKDYEDPKRYNRSEHRHALTLRACTNVTIERLTVESSGGDGIYVGSINRKFPASRNLTLREVVFKNHLRQGISVISCEHLRVDKCIFEDTGKTSPSAGVDLEPNHPHEMLSDLVFTDSVFRNNFGDGCSNSAMKLGKRSKKVTATFRNCVFEGNLNQVTMMAVISLNPEQSGVHGEYLYENCRFLRPRKRTIYIRDILHGNRITFRNCLMDNRGAGEKSFMFVDIGSLENELNAALRFENVQILTDHPDALLEFRAPAGLPLSSLLSGKDVTVNGKPVDLNGLWSERQSRNADLQKMGLAALDPTAVRDPAGFQKPEKVTAGTLGFRGFPKVLLSAKAGEKVQFVFVPRQVGRYTRKISLDVKDPAGKSIWRQDAIVCDNQPVTVEFTAETGGLYCAEFLCKGQMVSVGANVPYAVMMQNAFTLLTIPGKLYFEVPAGTSEFAIVISSYDYRKNTGMVLVSPDGKRIMPERRDKQTLVFKGTGNGESRIWHLELSCSGLYTATVQFMAPLPGMAAEHPENLLRIK